MHNRSLCYINNSSFSIDRDSNNYRRYSSNSNNTDSNSNVDRDIDSYRQYNSNINRRRSNSNSIAISTLQNHDEKGHRLYEPIINNNYITKRRSNIRIEDKLMGDKKTYHDNSIKRRLLESKKLDTKRKLITKLNPQSKLILSNSNNDNTNRIRKKEIGKPVETFHPKINEYSLQLLKRNSYHYNDHYDNVHPDEVWYMKSKVWQDNKSKKLEKERRQKEITLLKECTFRPAINDNDGDDNDGIVIRHDTTIVERFLDAKKKRDIYLEAERRKKAAAEMAECTFAPCIDVKSSKKTRATPPPATTNANANDDDYNYNYSMNRYLDDSNIYYNNDYLNQKYHQYYNNDDSNDNNVNNNVNDGNNDNGGGNALTKIKIRMRKYNTTTIPTTTNTTTKPKPRFSVYNTNNTSSNFNSKSKNSSRSSSSNNGNSDVDSNANWSYFTTDTRYSPPKKGSPNTYETHEIIKTTINSNSNTDADEIDFMKEYEAFCASNTFSVPVDFNADDSNHKVFFEDVYKPINSTSSPSTAVSNKPSTNSTSSPSTAVSNKPSSHLNTIIDPDINLDDILNDNFFQQLPLPPPSSSSPLPLSNIRPAIQPNTNISTNIGSTMDDYWESIISDSHFSPVHYSTSTAATTTTTTTTNVATTANSNSSNTSIKSGKTIDSKIALMTSEEANEILATWVHTQMDNIDNASECLSLVFELCNSTDANSYVDQEGVQVFIEGVQSVSFLEESFGIDTNVKQAMKHDGSNHEIIIGCNEVLDHIGAFSEVLQCLYEFFNTPSPIKTADLFQMMNTLSESDQGQYITKNLLPAYDIEWKRY